MQLVLLAAAMRPDTTRHGTSSRQKQADQVCSSKHHQSQAVAKDRRNVQRGQASGWMGVGRIDAPWPLMDHTRRTGGHPSPGTDAYGHPE